MAYLLSFSDGLRQYHTIEILKFYFKSTKKRNEMRKNIKNENYFVCVSGEDINPNEVYNKQKMKFTYFKDLKDVSFIQILKMQK